MSYSDAAVALHVPVSTVRSRLSRARQRLRRQAENELASRTGRPAEQLVTEQRTRGLPARGQEPDDVTETARSTQERHR
ncbi:MULTISPECIES: sigma factor-like helix-turn-helix DNA-binding protein [unclassified Streptomyces]|uniref:sigma factor-like helix-turn-helix DNA-binding protein n=1 Tax=unclassified Streptomyces TaxID=2593676 RepID=UPI002D21E833|nr:MULTISPECIES: sigma factor-like helix-turn-helix DNA-binding protein [unclassified Streptomyces]